MRVVSLLSSLLLCPLLAGCLATGDQPPAANAVPASTVSGPTGAATTAAPSPENAEQRPTDPLRAEAERIQSELRKSQEQRDKVREDLAAMDAYNSEVTAIGRRIRAAQPALDKVDAEIARRDLELKLPSRVRRWAMAELPPEN